MGMVGKQRPGQKAGTGFLGKVPQTSHKIFPILIIPEYRFPFNSANHHMMQRSGLI
jgi:hypothetical protein